MEVQLFVDDEFDNDFAGLGDEASCDRHHENVIVENGSEGLHGGDEPSSYERI